MPQTSSYQRQRRIWIPLWLIFLGGLAQGAFVPVNETPPATPREFRAAWVATVNNIDWPSRPGLSTAQQQQELISLVDQAVALKLNAVLFQVRPACDAFYESRLEPWSEYLSGTMGQPPQPYYDPLAFVIQEAHRRGLELHAWFNPFRARHHATQGPLSSRHIARTHPQWVKNYGRYLWLDPGEPAVHEYSLKVIMDVVQRYDIDGVHLDDYFYPYKEKDSRGHVVEFPDAPSYKRYQSQGGKLAREDWRRDQVNSFIRRLYQAVKAEKAWVKLGISPFGIWRPGNPKGIDGLDSFNELYADSRKWWNSGWVDYLAPQLYWAIDEKEHSFPLLLKWWAEQNLQHRHLWPGLNSAAVGGKYQTDEILRQIQAVRATGTADGEIHWSAKVLLQNRQGLGDKLASGPYSQRVLVPSFPWLDRVPPARPTATAEIQPGSGEVVLSWENGSPEQAARWVVQMRQSGNWHSEIFPSTTRSCRFATNGNPDRVSVIAVDRCGNLSPAAILARVANAPAPIAKAGPAPAGKPTASPGRTAATPPAPSPAQTASAPAVSRSSNAPPAAATSPAPNREGQSSDRSRLNRVPLRPVPGSSAVTGR